MLLEWSWNNWAPGWLLFITMVTVATEFSHPLALGYMLQDSLKLF